MDQLRAIHVGQVEHGQVIGSAFATVRDLVLRHGRWYTRKPLPRARFSREPEACYANALAAAMTCGWVYVDGYATTNHGGLPILHAWDTDPNNTSVAYDSTWNNGCEYFGIPFQRDYVLRMHSQAGHPGVLDAWNRAGRCCAAKTSSFT